MPQYIVYAQQVLYVERVIDAPDAEAAATIADQLVQKGMLQPVNSVEFENGVLCEVVEADVPTKEAPPASTLLDVFGEPPSDAPAFGENKLDFLAKSRLNTILFATEPRKIGKTWWVYAVYNSAFFPGAMPRRCTSMTRIRQCGWIHGNIPAMTIMMASMPGCPKGCAACMKTMNRLFALHCVKTGSPDRQDNG